MCIEIDKCVFSQKESTFLAFIVNRQGLWMDPEKVKAIVDWPSPTNRKEVQQVLG
jgi:hypothetical protein